MDQFAALPNDLSFYPELNLQALEVMRNDLLPESTDSEEEVDEEEEEDVFLPDVYAPHLTFSCRPPMPLLEHPRSTPVTCVNSSRSRTVQVIFIVTE